MHVVDKGCGIKAQNMDKLFTLFGTIKNDAKVLNNDSIGMGLLICKQIVQNTGGKISCYSAGEGQGATFIFSMRMDMPRLDNDLSVIEE